MKRGDKRGIALDYLGWLAIGVAVLIIVLLGIFLFKDKGTRAVDFIKNLIGWK